MLERFQFYRGLPLNNLSDILEQPLAKNLFDTFEQPLTKKMSLYLKVTFEQPLAKNLAIKQFAR